MPSLKYAFFNYTFLNYPFLQYAFLQYFLSGGGGGGVGPEVFLKKRKLFNTILSLSLSGIHSF